MLAGRSILRFACGFVAIYGLLVAAGVELRLFAHTERMLLAAVEPVLGAIEGAEVRRKLGLHELGVRVLTSAPWSAKSDYVLQGSYYHHTHNLFVLVALVLASPSIGWRLRAAGLAAGLPAVFLLDVLILMGDVWELDREAFGGVHPAMAGGPLPLLAFVAGRLHPTGGVFLLPAFLWVFALLARAAANGSRGETEGRSSRRSPRPDDPRSGRSPDGPRSRPSRSRARDPFRRAWS
jgi:hypothetical protein